MATDIHAVIARAIGGKSSRSSQATDDVLVALAANGVELVADLPPARRVGPTTAAVQRDDGEHRYNAHPEPGQGAAAARRMAADWLATARALEAEPQPDPADVGDLATLIASSDNNDGLWREQAEALARDLLRAGVRLPEGGAR